VAFVSCWLGILAIVLASLLFMPDAQLPLFRWGEFCYNNVCQSKWWDHARPKRCGRRVSRVVIPVYFKRKTDARLSSLSAEPNTQRMKSLDRGATVSDTIEQSFSAGRGAAEASTK